MCATPVARSDFAQQNPYTGLSKILTRELLVKNFSYEVEKFASVIKWRVSHLHVYDFGCSVPFYMEKSIRGLAKIPTREF